MIDLPMDEANCFDYFSILEIKFKMTNDIQKDIFNKQIKFYLNNLSEKLGDEKVSQILNSREYKILKNCNKDIFDVKANCFVYSVQACFVEKLNLKRHNLKQNLQKKFFNKNLSEIKLHNLPIE